MRGVDFVFHMAANADIKDNFNEPRKCVDQNIVVTQNVLEAMRAAGTQEIAFSSTGSVYGEADGHPDAGGRAFPRPDFDLRDAPRSRPRGCSPRTRRRRRRRSSRVWIFRFVSLLGPRYTHGHVVDFCRKLKADPTRLAGARQRPAEEELPPRGRLRRRRCSSPSRRRASRSTSSTSVTTDWIEVKESIEVITKTMGLSPRIEYAGGERGWPGDSPKILLDTKRMRALGWAPTKTHRGERRRDAGLPRRARVHAQARLSRRGPAAGGLARSGRLAVSDRKCGRRREGPARASSTSPHGRVLSRTARAKSCHSSAHDLSNGAYS